jgi:arylsulfatase A-like enzyme
MLTGTYPAFHGAVNINDELDADRSPFLARMLADAGYETAGFTGGGYVSTIYGFGEGFDRYSHNDPVWALDAVRGQQLLRTRSWERVPAQVAFLTRYSSPSIVDWIERREQGTPFFAFLHTYIVHNYAPDQEWLERRGLKGEDGSEQPFNHQERTRFNAGETELLDHVYEQYMPYYDATIGMADDFVGEVLDALDRAGLADNTIVIVTSDHGEEFGEHGFFGHGETLYEGNTRIPLIARVPAGLSGVRQPAVLDEPVSLVDIAPWILNLVGLEPDKRMATVAPLGPTRLDPPGRESLFIELDTQVNRLSALRDGDWTLHRLLGGAARGLEPDGRLLFEVATDPGETTDRAGDEAGRADRMSRTIDRFHELAEAVTPRGDSEPVDYSKMTPEQLDMLIQLGYLDADQVQQALGGGDN